MKTRLLTNLIALTFLLAGCAAPTTAQPSSITIPSILTTTETPSSTPTTRTVLPTNVPSPTGTSSPTVSMTPTTITTTSPTPLSTLAANEAQTEVLDLLKTNGGCRLPCWWGITPGKTSAQDARLFLDRFGSITLGTIFDDTSGLIDIQIPQNSLLVTLTFTYYENTSEDTVERISVSVNVVREVEDGYQTAYEDPHFAQLLQPFTLPQILNTYGRPSQVLVQGIRGHWLFYLLLSFPEAGFLVNYVAPLEQMEDTYSGCPFKAYVRMWLWPPERGYSLDEAAEVLFGERFGKEWLEQYLPLEDATSLTSEEFFTAFRNISDESCLETPVNLWPEP